ARESPKPDTGPRMGLRSSPPPAGLRRRLILPLRAALLQFGEARLEHVQLKAPLRVTQDGIAGPDHAAGRRVRGGPGLAVTGSRPPARPAAVVRGIVRTPDCEPRETGL